MTTYNLGDLTITGDPAIPLGMTLNVANTLWGDLTLGQLGAGTVAIDGDGTVAIGKDLSGDIYLLGQMDLRYAAPTLRRSLISIGRNFTEGAEIDFTPTPGDDFYGDITVGGDWVGTLDVNGAGSEIWRTGQIGPAPNDERGPLFTVGGNFGSPHVTGSLIDIEDGRWYMSGVAQGDQGIRIGADGTGIMYGDIAAHALTNTGYGRIYAVRMDIGANGVSTGDDAYMAHTAKIAGDREVLACLYIYGNNSQTDAFQGQILGGVNGYCQGQGSMGISGYYRVQGGMSEQAEIRALRATRRYAYVSGLDGAFNAGVRFYNTVAGAICAGDGYDTDDWPASETWPEEAYAYFGRSAYIDLQNNADFTGIIRSFAQGTEDGMGEFQGVFHRNDIDIRGEMSGEILGYYVSDIEMTGGFTGRIEAFNEFKGGGVRLSGTNTGTIRAGGSDLTYYQGSIAAGAVWNRAFGVGTLDVRTDPGNGGSTTYSYLYSGSGETIEALRFDNGARNIDYIDVEGSVAGQITVVRNMTDNRIINIAGDLTATGRIDVDGALSGDILIGGDADGFVQINNMAATGNLMAALFGDVEILGDFLGRIGDSGTSDGVGNTLNLHSSGNTINGQVYRQTPGPAGYQPVGPGDDPAFGGAFAAIEDADL